MFKCIQVGWKIIMKIYKTQNKYGVLRLQKYIIEFSIRGIELHLVYFNTLGVWGFQTL